MESPNNLNRRLEHLQLSVLVIVLRLLAVLFLLDTIYALTIIGYFGLSNAHEWHNSYIWFLWLAHIVKYIIVTILVIRLFADWAGRAYYLAGHHLIERLGLVNNTETTYELSQVKSVVVKQNWLGRHFNYGTIKLSFAGSGVTKDVILRDIHNPNVYKEYFDQHLQVQGWVR